MSLSKIEWTDRTWNPVTGCTKVSQGCKHCYAEGVANRFWHHQYVHTAERGFIPVKAYAADALTGRPRKFTDVMTHEDRLLEPLRWRKPAKVFVNSMSDLFHEDVPFEFVDRVFSVMAAATHLTFQILTKRPDRMRAYVASFDTDGDAQRLNGPMSDLISDDLTRRQRRLLERGISSCLGVDFEEDGEEAQVETLDWPLSNVWLGVSVEDQATADLRIPVLVDTPAAIRFVSYEPALGAVDFRRYVTNVRTIHMGADVEGMLTSRAFDYLHDGGRRLNPEDAEKKLRELLAAGVRFIPTGGPDGKPTACDAFSEQTGCPGHQRPRLDWIIVGGESGPGARPFNVEWARATVEQGRAAGVSVFVKQLGDRPVTNQPSDLPDWSSARGRCGDHQHVALHHVRDRRGGVPAEWPEDLRVREFPR